MAESKTRTMRPIPSANHRIWDSTCTGAASQTLHRPRHWRSLPLAPSFVGAVSRRSSGGGGPASGSTGGACRRGGTASPTSWASSSAGADRRAARRPAASAAVRGRAHGCGPVTASRTRSARATGPSRSSRRSRWRGAERRRRRDREPHLDPRVRRVGVLATRPTGARRAPLELVETDDARRVHAQTATFSGTLGGGDAGSRAPVSATWVRVPAGNFRMGDARGVRTHEHGRFVHESAHPGRRDRAHRRERHRVPGDAARPRRPRRAAPKPGGSDHLRARGRDRRRLVPVDRSSRDLGHRGGRRDLRHARRCRTPRTRSCPYLAKSVEPNADLRLVDDHAP